MTHTLDSTDRQSNIGSVWNTVVFDILLVHTNNKCHHHQRWVLSTPAKFLLRQICVQQLRSSNSYTATKIAVNMSDLKDKHVICTSAPPPEAAPAAVTAAAAATSSSDVTMFEVGETVSVKDYGNAVIVSGPVQEPGRFFGRWLIRFSDGKQYHARPSNLRRFEKVRQQVHY